MSILWQQIIIGLMLGAAVGYLIWRAVRRRRREAKCAGCQLRQSTLLDRPDIKRP